MGKMAQLLRALAFLSEYLNSVPESTSGVTDICNFSSSDLDLQMSVTMPLTATGYYTHVHRVTCRHTSTHNINDETININKLLNFVSVTII